MPLCQSTGGAEEPNSGVHCSYSTQIFFLKSLTLIHIALQREDSGGFQHEDGLPEDHPPWVRNTTAVSAVLQ
jgi:hypothetical protein